MQGQLELSLFTVQKQLNLTTCKAQEAQKTQALNNNIFSKYSDTHSINVSCTMKRHSAMDF